MSKTKEKTQKEEYLQWHPAFYATAQIETAGGSKYLIFEMSISFRQNQCRLMCL